MCNPQRPYIQAYTDQLNPEEMPATTSILNKQGISLKQIRPHRILAGYEAGDYYVNCQEGIRLIDLQELNKKGYKPWGFTGVLKRRR